MSDLRTTITERESLLARLRAAYRFSESEAVYFADQFEAEHLGALYGKDAAAGPDA